MGHGRSMMSDTRAVTYCFIINISSSIRLFHFILWVGVGLHRKTVFVLSEEQKQRLMQGHSFDGAALPDVPADSVNFGAGGLYPHRATC